MFMQQAPNSDLSPFSLQGKDLADPNAFGTSGMDPNKQQMLAKMLMSMGKQSEGTQYENGWAVEKPMDFGSLLGGLASSYMMGK